MSVVLELLLAPMLVGLATLAARRWQEHVGGLLSAFPAIVGPLLLLAADAHGSAFAARSATGTLAGLAALSAFILVYAHVGARRGWRPALAAGWTAAAAVTAGIGLAEPGVPGAMVLAVGSLVLTYVAMPRASGEPPVAVLTNTQVGQRMALTLVLVAALAWAAHRFGPLIGGTLAALPVLASILAVTTHRQQGAPAMIALLRGMVAGMGSFVVFCLAVALLVVPATAASFAIALAAAIAVQLMALGVVQPDALSDREHRRRRQRPGLPGAVARARH